MIRKIAVPQRRGQRLVQGRLSRRDFLSAGAIGALLPLVGRASPDFVEKEPDVVIVGAGAAGIAAAHALQSAGVSYALVEASDRIGGRAWTDTTTFDAPFDIGAHWLGAPDGSTRNNPYFARARESDYRLYEAPEQYRVFKPDGEASSQEVEALWRAYDGAVKEMGTAGKRGRDVSPAQVLSDKEEWARTAWFMLGPWEMAKDMEDFSCVDWWNSSDVTDWYCAQGLGRLVADYGANIPVALRTPVTRIHWDGPGVRVETSDGTIRARAVIITASTGVLAAEAIDFSPALPTEKQEAFNGISMGHYNRIAAKFSEDIFGMGEDGYLCHRVDQSREAFAALSNASGTGITYCDVGGSFAQELERAGRDEATDFILGRLRSMVGKDVDRFLEKTAVTGWSGDSFFRGAYASARPGAYPLRKVIRRSVGDRIYFAGEACHRSLWGTVGGADLSGVEVAREVARRIT